MSFLCPRFFLAGISSSSSSSDSECSDPVGMTSTSLELDAPCSDDTASSLLLISPKLHRNTDRFTISGHKTNLIKFYFLDTRPWPGRDGKRRLKSFFFACGTCASHGGGADDATEHAPVRIAGRHSVSLHLFNMSAAVYVFVTVTLPCVSRDPTVRRPSCSGIRQNKQECRRTPRTLLNISDVY